MSPTINTGVIGGIIMHMTTTKSTNLKTEIDAVVDHEAEHFVHHGQISGETRNNLTRGRVASNQPEGACKMLLTILR